QIHHRAGFETLRKPLGFLESRRENKVTPAFEGTSESTRDPDPVSDFGTVAPHAILGRDHSRHCNGEKRSVSIEFRRLTADNGASAFAGDTLDPFIPSLDLADPPVRIRRDRDEGV